MVLFGHTATVAPEKRLHHPPAAVFSSGGQGDDMAEKKLTYWEQLRHPLWQQKRLEVLSAAGWECDECGGNEATLHVHHRQYFKGRKAWEYERHELAVLCESCHEQEHAYDERLKTLLSVVGSREALVLLSGFYAHDLVVSKEFLTDQEHEDPWTFWIGTLASIARHADATTMLAAAMVIANRSRPTTEARPKLDAFKQSIGVVCDMEVAESAAGGQ
jgi:5-methylcytosine-specific restriction endonuclease McrA